MDVEFSLRDGVPVNDYSFMVHLRQFVHGAEFPEVYGNVSFQINTTDREGLFRKVASSNEEENNAVAKANGGFKIFPNPVNDKLQISYLNDEAVTATLTVYDITGRKMVTKENQHFKILMLS